MCAQATSSQEKEGSWPAPASAWPAWSVRSCVAMISFSAQARGRASPIALVAHGFLLLIAWPGVAMGQDEIDPSTGRIGQMQGDDETCSFTSVDDLVASSGFPCALVLGNAGEVKVQER